MRMFAPSVVLSWTRVKHRYWWLLFSIHLFLLICKAACCKFVLKVSKIGGGALPGFTCGTVTPQLVQLCVFCSYVVAWYVWKIDFCIALSERVCARRAPRVVACFFCGAVLFLSCFFHFLSYGFLGTLYYEILHVFFLLVLFIRRVRSRRQCYFQHRHLVWLPRLPPPTML